MVQLRAPEFIAVAQSTAEITVAEQQASLGARCEVKRR
jgi:hypothetical protein